MPSDGALEFVERFVALLDGGRYTATYKFAVLTALIDVVVESVGADGRPPDAVPARRVGERVLELYWRQARPYPSATGAAQSAPQHLRHSTLSVDLITKIVAFKRTHHLDIEALDIARTRYPDDLNSLEDEVVVTVIRMPIPKLQRFREGSSSAEDRFLYDFSWADEVSASRIRRADFDDSLRLRKGVAELLTRLEPVLRPMIQQRWAAFVAGRSQDLVEDRWLDDFLFGSRRVALRTVHEPLLNMQQEQCFYCQQRTTIVGSEVDHFVPWARHPDNGLHNLVIADRACNNAKRDSLASADHLIKWVQRFIPGSETAQDLSQVEEDTSWSSHSRRTLGSARAAYLWLPSGRLLWVGRNDYQPADPGALRAIMSSIL